MKILITGTHFTPAVAVINELKKRKDMEIVYVGRGTTQEGDPTPSQESGEIPKLGVKFISIIAGRLQRSLTFYTIPSLLKLPIGFIQAFYIVLREKPDVILSFGGYIGIPVVFTGYLLSIPIIIHEQTLVSGLANKLSSLFADKIAVSFETDKLFKDKKTVLTGNPIRDEVLHPGVKLPSEYQDIFTVSRKEKLPLILIMGGNQGSHTINIALERILNQLKKISCLIHVTGESKYYDFERLIKLQDERYLVKKWIGKEYGAILKKVDLIICRAGINTLTEIAYMDKPALVIPIPYLYQDEQNKNAKYFANLGLARILPQTKLSGKSLLRHIQDCFNDLNLSRVKSRDQWSKNMQRGERLNIPDAAKNLALETILLSHRYR